MKVALLDRLAEAGEIWQKISNFDIDDPLAKLPFSACLAHEMGWSFEFTQLAICEYKKFMLLCSQMPGQTVPSTHVDTVWHMHLLYTRNYQRFCHEAIGCEFIHHQPASGDDEEALEFKSLYRETLQRYLTYFNQKPPIEIWGE